MSLAALGRFAAAFAMPSQEIAVIADVHANVTALAAVLADIERRGVTAIVNLGDDANGPLDPAGTVARLRELRALHVRGNGDRMTGEGGATARRSAQYARERLAPDALRWLRERPAVVRGAGFLACHGTPQSDEKYLLETVVDGRVVLADSAEIRDRLGNTGDATLVLCGHSHMPRQVRLDDGRLIVNPGSVGLPAYADSQPTPHVVGTGSPQARYAIVRGATDCWTAELIAVDYDWAAAAAAARTAGWEEWARNLETGCA